MKNQSLINCKLLFFCALAFLFNGCTSNIEDAKSSLTPIEEADLWKLANNNFRPLTYPDSLYHSTEDSIRINLGQQLFYDKNLSSNRNISCNTCHPIEDFGMDRRSTAMGHNRSIGKRNTPTVLNAFLQYAQFWDARASTVEDQLLEPLLNQREMGMRDTSIILEYVNGAYKPLVQKAFPLSTFGLAELKQSIGSFERTLIAPSRFDDYLLGLKHELSIDEKQGLLYFVQEGCVSCHNGVLLGGNMAQKFALFGYYWDYTKSDTYDDGVYGVTKNAADKFLFKVSGLRNIAQTAPFFHDGSVDNLYDAIDIMAKSELGKTLDPYKIRKIESFLKSLTGELKDYQSPLSKNK